MDTSGYISEFDFEEQELALGPQPSEEEIEEPVEKPEKPNFFDRLNTTLTAINNSADTVNRVIDTGKKAVTPVPEGTKPGQGFDMKTVGILAAGAGLLYGIVKLVTTKKK
jgi:hypothetical protein